MENLNLSKLLIKINSLTVFHSLKSDPVISSLSNYLQTLNQNNEACSVLAYSKIIHELYESEFFSLSAYIKKLVGDNENVYIRMIGAKNQPPHILKKALDSELKILQEIADLDFETLTQPISDTTSLAGFINDSFDISSYYSHRIDNIEKYGYGIYAKHRMFYINNENHIVPVKNPDSISLTQLYNYKREQEIILSNTKALLDGKPAANILLTGDAGTGKSSTIKAVVNELYENGLRILEVRKEQLIMIPAILDELSQNPLKFILFIDDLSFQKDDDNFSALKAILEGSVSSRSQNVVIYATSNRRHLVKEKFSDREGDDVHFNDTMQQIISLSERFGIHITFNRPDKATYLDIVHNLVSAKGIEFDIQKLDTAAERFALARGNRSARAAKQFADSLASADEQVLNSIK